MCLCLDSEWVGKPLLWQEIKWLWLVGLTYNKKIGSVQWRTCVIESRKLKYVKSLPVDHRNPNFMVPA